MTRTKDFRSFTLYDNQTRSMLQTDERFPGIDNKKEGMKQNDDGSYTSSTDSTKTDVAPEA